MYFKSSHTLRNAAVRSMSASSGPLSGPVSQLPGDLSWFCPGWSPVSLGDTDPAAPLTVPTHSMTRNKNIYGTECSSLLSHINMVPFSAGP